jgi:hypothetical protein
MFKQEDVNNAYNMLKQRSSLSATAPRVAPRRPGSLSPSKVPNSSPSASIHDRLASLEAQNKALMSQLENNQKQLHELRQSMTSRPVKSAARPNPSTSSASSPALSTVSKSTEQAKSISQSQPAATALAAGPDSILQPGPNPDLNPGLRTPGLRTPGLRTSGLRTPGLSAPGAAPMSAMGANAASSSAIGSLADASQVPASSLAPEIPLRGVPGISTDSDAGNFVDTAAASIPTLELAGVHVQPTGVKLNVIMRNPTSKDVDLPTSTRAVVRMPGLPDQYAKIKFAVKKIAAGGEAKGYISVSGHKIDPSADVFIPNLMSIPGGPKDVHLTVPISSLIGQSR